MLLLPPKNWWIFLLATISKAKFTGIKEAWKSDQQKFKQALICNL